ncbi:type II methionyl aminopeptidase [Candidatus Woesearchaeota archaeon]|nr:type II methionyl aminopeptidase [Candidatus Woesearchaeota archaeon]
MEEDWIKAGKIAAESLAYGRSLAKPGIKLLELAEKIEAKIFELGGRPAFPVNLSLNHIAAHYTPSYNDETAFKEEDILKIDVGVHVNGCVGDTACSVGNNKELIKASEEALKAAIKIFTPGTKIREVGKAIQEQIQSYGFSPIRNLSGHGIAEYNLHSGITIPNYDNGDEKVLEDGQIIAIEPFATTGQGVIEEGKPSGIFRLQQAKPTRSMSTRQLLKFVAEEYKTLPFAKRWVINKIPGATLALITMEREGMLHHYPQLPERSKGLVSQAEHTLLVKDKPKILTKID